MGKVQSFKRKQFGFRQNHSITHISHMHDTLFKNFDEGKYSCCIFLDLSKAFDTVNHKTLLTKLKTQFGIPQTPLELLKNFLSERQLYLNFEGEISEFANITCGIPQGSSLGPLLFLLYVNDIPTITNLDTTLFAVDTYLQMSDQNLLVLESRVNIELEKINWWLRKSKLALNFEKTSYTLVHKQPQKSVSKNFKLIVNYQTLLEIIL